MTFPFVFVCDLLSRLQKQHANGGQPNQGPSRDAILARWFKDHRGRLDHPSTDMVALFSTLLPEKRVDRVYLIKTPRLAQIIGRACGLGMTRKANLHLFEEPGNGDLADCVMKVMEEAPNPWYDPKQPVTIEEIDALLDSLASNCHFSSDAVRSRRSATKPLCHEDLGNFFLRLSPVESMWLTRLVLKDYGGACLDDKLVYRTYDPRLSKVLRIQDNFETALRSLRQLRNAHPLGIGHVLKHVKPLLGTKVGRQTWLKGRSIKDCFDMSPARISCEKKMDGEYCQIHIDMTKRYDNIQIFSKSGKDSTMDRQELHPNIREALKLGRQGQAIRRNCILEGELVVYNDREKKIMPFDVIRKYVSRSGVRIGVGMDSPRDPDEHPMIVFFDVLLIDDESLLELRQTRRFDRLKQLITCRTGYAELVKRQIIDLDRNLGVSHLRKALAESIANREEGLVLKPDKPYFDFGNAERKFFSCPIKVKKEYFKGLGDIGDFAVVGARYDAAHAKTYSNIPGIKWTQFFLGCLENKKAALSHQEKPRFVIVCSLKNFIQFVHPDSVDIGQNDAFELHIPPRMSSSKGPIFDIYSFSFDLEGNTGYLTPRFPQVSKVHYDRDFMDTVTFQELEGQKLPDDHQEMLDSRGRAVDAVSQSTVSSEMTPSPRSCLTRQSHSQQSLGGSPTKRRERIHTAAPAPASAVARAVRTGADPAPRQDPQAGRATAGPSFRATGNFKRNLPRSSTTTEAEAKRQRKQTVNETVTTTTPSSPLTILKQPAIMDASSPSPGDQFDPVEQDDSMIAGAQPQPGPQLAAIQPVAANNAAPVVYPSLYVGRALAGHVRVPGPARPAAHPVLAADAPVLTAPSPSSSDHPLERGRCRFIGGRCSMPGRSVLLAQSCQDHEFLTQVLLPSHGINEWVTDPRAWAQNATEGAVVQTGSPPPEDHTQGAQQQQQMLPIQFPRKTCFVECGYTEKLQELITQIEDLELTRPDGSREWVEIYDWRALEAMMKIEMKLAAGQISRGVASQSTLKAVGSYFVGLA
ncbi:ATP dependent DNA ligase domain-containing protein [Plectosphaerella plurivora]|uniref:ATP dependent DNA ligase domain-containing protein n=1 Tax=Plectosphaerella plurivora TaxID=936078 RepID=A0A9P9ACJ0_9PEZI|nr:ATP dependent DNA ligase domain-containing protein [Plectosphaerella plurivora]